MRILAVALLALAPLSYSVESTPLRVAIEQKRAKVEATGNGRDSIHLQATATEKTKISIPAGACFESGEGEVQIALRSLEITPGPGSDVDAFLPAAALKSSNQLAQRSVALKAESEPRLSRLLELFGQQNDLPRPTAQLAVFLALEDISWAAWKTWMAPIWNAEKPAKPHPTPAEVAQAVDAIAFAKLAQPDRTFTILADEDFKRLALRNPWARGKAMALYGLTVEDAITGDTSLPPDLGKLLHTSPNDNCPICRQRSKEPADIP